MCFELPSYQALNLHSLHFISKRQTVSNDQAFRLSIKKNNSFIKQSYTLSKQRNCTAVYAEIKPEQKVKDNIFLFPLFREIAN